MISTMSERDVHLSEQSLTKICRLCLQEDSDFSFSIFDRHDPNPNKRPLKDRIFELYQVKISPDDGLPTNICQECLVKTELCSDFRARVHECERQLQSFVTSTGIKKSCTPRNDVNQNGLAAFDLEDDSNDGSQVVVIDPSKFYASSEDEAEATEESSPNVSSDQPSKPAEQEKPARVKKGTSAPKSEPQDQFQNVFFCKYCDAAYSSQEEREAHENNDHDALNPYACNFCPFKSADRVTVISHIKYLHDAEKPFVCVQCGKRYNRRSDLKKHAVAHTGIRPFACTHCPKTFSRNTNLRKHMKVHQSGKAVLHPATHSDNGAPKIEESSSELQGSPIIQHLLLSQNHPKGEPKSFSCDKCPKRFSKLSQLSSHKSVHSSPGVAFACATCPKTFKTKRDLDRHSLVHKAVTQFQCSICSKTFLRRDKLLRHEKIHKSKRLAALPESAFLPENLKRHGPLQQQSAAFGADMHPQQPHAQTLQQEQHQQMMRPQFYAEYDLSQTN